MGPIEAKTLIGTKTGISRSPAQIGAFMKRNGQKQPMSRPKQIRQLEPRAPDPELFECVIKNRISVQHPFQIFNNFLFLFGKKQLVIVNALIQVLLKRL